MAKQTKYRPSLTLQQITHILELAGANISEASFSLIGTLAPYMSKIENEAIIAAHTKKRLEPTEEDPTGAEVDSFLSESEAQEPKESNTHRVDTNLPKVEYWEHCYDKYSINPNGCSLKELKAVQEHKYLNDLMSAKEVLEFEKSAFDS